MAGHNHYITSDLMTSLLQRMARQMQSRNFAPATQRSYLHYVTEFVRYHNCDPRQLDMEAIRRYQLHLLSGRKLSPESVNAFNSAVRFLYLDTLEMPWQKEDFVRARLGPRAAPLTLGCDEIRRLFQHIPGVKNRAALMLCYGAGLSLSEAVAVKISNIEGRRGLLRIEHRDPSKNRNAPLSPALLGVLRTYWRIVRPSGPWLFPSWRAEKHIGSRVLERACREAWQLAGLPKRISPRMLRHSFSGWLMDKKRANARVIHAVLGEGPIGSKARFKADMWTNGPLDQLLMRSSKRAKRYDPPGTLPGILPMPPDSPHPREKKRRP